MSLCRYLPVPSDRMGIIWSLLSVKDSIILEYGPAGTTHFSMGFYGTLGVDWQQRLVTTHMNVWKKLLSNWIKAMNQKLFLSWHLLFPQLLVLI